MPEPSIDDYRWLVSEQARPFLEDATSSTVSLVAQTNRLRKALSLERVHLVLEQVELRSRAQVKFSAAQTMFFTRKLLEQSTDERIADHKARRFPRDERIADLCCGIGGDSLALARRTSCVAVDRDPIATLLVAANGLAVEANHLTCQVADVRSALEQLECQAWHIDPDRRVAAQRTSQAVYSEPGLDVIQALLHRVDAGAMKIAPGAELPDDWVDDSRMEIEWIGSRRECRQQVVWMGQLATNPGKRTATIIESHGNSHSFTGEPDTEVDVAATGRFLFSPHSTLLASRLDGALAEQHHLHATSYGLSYYTADESHALPLMEAFEVQEIINLDIKRLKRLLRERQIGSLEIKVRGVDVDPKELRKKLQLKGSNNATLLIFQSGESVVSAITKRCGPR